MGYKITGGAVGKAICDSIHTAEITYRDSAGNILFVQDVGTVSPGGTIQVKVPEPDDISIEIGY